MQWVVRSATWGCYSGGLRRESESFSELHILSSLCSFAPHSPTHSLICSLVLSLLIYSLIFSLTYPHTHTHTHSLIYYSLALHSLAHWFTLHSLTCSFVHSLIFSSLTHSLTCLLSLAHLVLTHPFAHSHSLVTCSLTLYFLTHPPTHWSTTLLFLACSLTPSLKQSSNQSMHDLVRQSIYQSITRNQPTNRSTPNN